MVRRTANGGLLGGASTPSSDTGSARERRPLRESRTLKQLDLDAAFFWLIVVFLVTVMAFFSMRPHNVQLTGKQVEEYERRTQFLANSTVYIVETGKPEGLLSVFEPNAWARVSHGIDFVAFVYDDLPLFLTESWVEAAELQLRAPDKPHFARVSKGIGIALFPCGCVLPNEYFFRVKERLGGLECTLLPGWVLKAKDVHWLDIPDTNDWKCRRRSTIMETRAAKQHRKALQSIRHTLEAIEKEEDTTTDAKAVKIDSNLLSLSKQAVVRNSISSSSTTSTTRDEASLRSSSSSSTLHISADVAEGHHT